MIVDPVASKAEGATALQSYFQKKAAAGEIRDIKECVDTTTAASSRTTSRSRKQRVSRTTSRLKVTSYKEERGSSADEDGESDDSRDVGR